VIRIPQNTTIIGEIRSSGEIRIDGRFQGQGNIDGTLILTETSVWIGDIVANTVVVEGVFEGDIIARKKLMVGPKAKIQGDIKAPAIKIAYGAQLYSDIDMKKPQVNVGLLEHKPETSNSKRQPIKAARFQYNDKKRA